MKKLFRTALLKNYLEIVFMALIVAAGIFLAGWAYAENPAAVTVLGGHSSQGSSVASYDSVEVYDDGAGKSVWDRLSSDNILKIIKSIPQLDQFNYVNKGSLSYTWFSNAEATLSDERLYIILSDTGSPASEVISVFTKKRFNHCSISFDRELETMVSYNGGNNAYPPGLNPEELSILNMKENASVMVYSLPCNAEKKRLALEEIQRINEEGSSYNMLGLVSAFSGKPNIMYCSQFVNKILDSASLAYFVKSNGKVEPADFIEFDYKRHLQFEYEYQFN